MKPIGKWKVQFHSWTLVGILLFRSLACLLARSLACGGRPVVVSCHGVSSALSQLNRRLWIVVKTKSIGDY